MNARKLIVLLTVFVIIAQVLNLPTLEVPRVKADTTTWTTSNLTTKYGDGVYNLGSGLLLEDQLLKTRDYTTAQSTFFYFPTVNVNSWGEVKTAKLSIYRLAASGNATLYNAKVYAIDLVDDMGFFYPTGPITPPETRPLTTAYTSVNDQHTNDWTVGWYNITVTNQVVEVLKDNYGWSSGNSLSFRIVNVAGADRYCRAYEYGTTHTYAAKLYVETYVARDYAGGWDTGTLVNSTDWGDLWQVSNSSVASFGLIGAVNANQGRIYRLNFTDYADLPSGYILWSNAGAMQTDGNKLFVSTASTLYCLAYKSSTGYVWLMNSTNSGDSWAAHKIVGYGPQYGMAYDGNNKIFTVYRSGADVYTYWTIYTISTKTVSTSYVADPNLSSVGRLSNPVYVPLGNKFMFTMCVGVNNYIFAFDMDTLTQDVVHGVAIGTNGYNPVIHPNADSTEFYNLWWVSDALYGYTIDDDCVTHGATETNIATGIYNYGNVWYDLDYVVNRWVCAYLSSANKFLYMVERPAGTWGAAVLKSNFYTMICFGIDYGSNILSSAGYAAFIQSYSTPTTKNVLSSAKAWGSVKTLTSIGSDVYGIDIVTVGAAGPSGYQFHYYNCTWLTATASPTIPPNPWVPIADPDTDDYPNPSGFLGRLQVRLYLIIFGFGLFVIPPILWSGGRTDLHEIGAGLISMLFGIALLMAAGYV